MRVVLTDFKIMRPRYETPQEESLRWLAAAHARMRPEVSTEHATAQMHKALRRFGCSAEMIGSRGHELSDFRHQDWERMEIFRLPAHAQGLEARTRFFGQAVEGVLERFYAEEQAPPQELLHVTCSGYLSPSPAQLLVAKRGWHQRTRVTHVYHMGCYAAFPAIRIAQGLGLGLGEAGRVDIVHTELCSLHLNPALHSPEQLVVQTLFADGFVRYSVRQHAAGLRGLEVLAVREEIIPETSDQMSWITADGGMQMSLARTVPAKLAEHLEGYLGRLFEQAGLSFERDLKSCAFAIHPGGPHIVDLIRDRLGLSEHDMHLSRKVLHDCGNMSSATLPHIWSALCDSGEIKPGTSVVSLAFGPGLTISGGLLRKSCS